MTSIHKDAFLDIGVQVEPFTTIYEDVIIGQGSWIGSNVTIFPGTRIGKNCKIFPGAVIGAIPQDLKFEGEYTQVVIDDNTTIRECVTVHRATKASNTTSIGKNCLIMAYAHVGHDSLIGNHVIIANSCSIAGHVTIEDFVVLEGLVAIQQFVSIGTHAFVAGASLVRKNVPPYVKAAREPLSYIGVNTIGLKRRAFLDVDIRHIEDIYRVLFIHNQNVSHGVEQIEEEIENSAYKSAILDFVKESNKGIIKGII
jgi:UDP-N-acetylglucosamine acyltransferase